MYTHTDVKTFQTVLKPLINCGTINQELFQVALQAIRNKLAMPANQVENHTDDKLVSRKEAAKMLGKSNKTIDRMRKDGNLRCTQIRSSIMFKKSDILAIMNNYEELKEV